MSTPAPLHCPRTAEYVPPRPVELPNGTSAWLATRYHDVRQVLTDPRFNRALLFDPDAPRFDDANNMVNDPDLLLNLDGAEHRRLRLTVQSAFTPKAIERWHPWVVSTVGHLVDDLVEQGPPADLIEGLALPLPVAVISRLLGLDEPDRDQLRRWTDHAFADATRSADQVQAVLAEFLEFAAELIAARRREPGEDLVSGLVMAADRQGGVPEAQLVRLVCALIAGGHDSTMTTLGNALVYLLAERSEIWPLLAGEEAAGRAVERLLHFIPLGDDEGIFRRAAEDVEVGGVIVPAGSTVMLDSTSANRDPAVFPSGLSGGLFDPLEARTLAFGAGPHHCVGNWLARLELRLALRQLALRLPGLRLAAPVSAIEWRCGTTTRGPRRLFGVW